MNDQQLLRYSRHILLDEFGQVKLSDFGLASCEATKSGHSSGPAGTLNYMAPEVAGGQAANVQSDMYSLGVMLYELTFGELPHQASSDSLKENLKTRQQATVQFPTVWPADRPEGWRDVLAVLLHKDPARRFESWETAIRELSLLSDRELADLGLCRHDIETVARRSASF